MEHRKINKYKYKNKWFIEKYITIELQKDVGGTFYSYRSVISFQRASLFLRETKPHYNESSSVWMLISMLLAERITASTSSSSTCSFRQLLAGPEMLIAPTMS